MSHDQSTPDLTDLEARIERIEDHLGLDDDDDDDESPSSDALVLLDYINEHQDYDRGIAEHALYNDMSRLHGLSENEVTAALNTLEKAGDIYSVERGATRRWKTYE